MIQPENEGSVADIEAAAADWLAYFDRMGVLDSDPGLTDLSDREPEFQTWLNSNLKHRIAFLQLLSTWQRTERLQVLEPGTDITSIIGKSGSQGKAAWVAGLTALAAAVTVTVLSPFMSWFQTTPAGEVEIYFSQLGQTREITLSDGSILTLNTNSRVDIEFEEGIRNVRLVRGEVLFDVARDEARPFRIDTPSGDIEVLGTVFAAELRSDSLEVAVIEGHVALMPESGEDDRRQEMTAGMIGYANQADVISESVGLREVEDRLLWRSGRIRFRNIALSDVAAEFNRYSPIQLEVQGPDVAKMRIGGTFAVDNMDGFLRLAESGLGLKVTRAGDRIEIAEE